jgi:hypothetical protein
MQTRLESAQKSRDSAIEEVLNETQVYIAGGDSIGGMLLETKIEEAAKACLDRLYPRFHEADHPDWRRVLDQARKGDGAAMEVVGHKADPENHPVCAAILQFVGSGKKGTEVRKHFTIPKYGWPQDAVDAALVVLHTTGKIQARQSGEPIPTGKLEQRNITTAEFRVEHITLAKVELIALRGLFGKAGSTVPPGQESQAAAKFLAQMKALGESAGGEAPRPRRPDLAHVEDLLQRVGNDQLKAIHVQSDRLLKEIAEWKARAEKIAQREPRWRIAVTLLQHADGLPEAAEVRPEIAAIEQNRSLLSEPDPVPGVIARLTEALRRSLKDAQGACVAAHDAGLAELEGSTTWQKLSPDQRYELLSQSGSRAVPEIAVGTTEEILDTLRQTKLSELRAIGDALPTRFSNALSAAAKLLEPKAQHVKLPGGTIRDEDDLKSWLRSAEDQIRSKMADGPVIL